MTNDVIQIAIDLIDEPRMAMRESVFDDELDSLVASIKQVGLLEPLVVRPVGERFELIAGHRRLTALKRIGNVLVLAKVMELDDKEALLVRVHENAHRENVNPVDEAVYFGQVMAQLNLSVGEMAEKLNRSEGYIYARLTILDFPDYLISIVAERKISVSAAIALSKIKDETTRRNFVEIAAKDGITLERANAWVAMVGVGSLTAETTAEQLKAMSQPEQFNSVHISCARCEVASPIRDMVTVWIHKSCPPSETPTS